MMSSTPLVSILINNYNYGRFLGEAIESALGQSYPCTEVIVVDDGSTDQSHAVLASFGDRVLPLLQANGGQATAFNAGFARSSGEYIFLLDADDLFLPDKVRHIVGLFESDRALGWVFDIVQTFRDAQERPVASATAARVEALDARTEMLAGTPPTIATATSGLAFRRSALKQLLPMPESGGIRLSDGFLKWTAMLIAPGVLVHGSFTLQRIHEENLFTRRKTGKARLGGEIEASTACAIQDRFPHAQRFSFKLLAHGIGALWATGGIDSAHQRLIARTLKQLPLSLRGQTYLRACYWALRAGAKQWRTRAQAS